MRHVLLNVKLNCIQIRSKENKLKTRDPFVDNNIQPGRKLLS
jgi:hypothetical protein